MTVFTERAVKTKNAGFQQEQNERAHCIQSQGERKTSSRITSGCQLSKALLQSLPAACEAASLQCPRVAQNPHCRTSPFTHVTLPRLCSPTRPASVQRPESGPERRVWWGVSANPQEGVRPGASWAPTALWPRSSISGIHPSEILVPVFREVCQACYSLHHCLAARAWRQSAWSTWGWLNKWGACRGHGPRNKQGLAWPDVERCPETSQKDFWRSVMCKCVSFISLKGGK